MNMPHKHLMGNWKMHTTVEEGCALLRALIQRELHVLTSMHNRFSLTLFPPAMHLASLMPLAKAHGIRLGAQHIYHQDAGAYTGENSPACVHALGGQATLIGHSERRQHFKETNEEVQLKVHAALRNHLQAVVCVGETRHEREQQQAEQVIQTQLQIALHALPASFSALDLVVAYEPVWAIGTGLVAEPAQIQDMHGFIRNQLIHLTGSFAQSIAIVYGGSVKSAYAETLLNIKEVDGLLVGGASLNATEFLAIAEAFH